MRFGARFQESDPDVLVEIARAAEQLGFESLWRGEHIIVPRTIKSIDPYYARALAPGIESFPVHDAAIIYAFVAARTTTIRLGFGALLLPLRHPVEAARMLMTLDRMSSGRAMVAVGLGWLREEFDILDQRWAGRGRRTEEAIQVMRTLWTERHPVHQGEHYDVPPVMFQPKPVQDPCPPILIAGVSPAAFDRAARVGDGWYGHDLTASEAQRYVADIGRRRERHGTIDRPFEYTGRTGRDASLADVEALAAAGLDRVVFDIGSVGAHGMTTVMRTLERLSSEVIDRL
jgi:probable F420-dependent oxidoreductase